MIDPMIMSLPEFYNFQALTISPELFSIVQPIEKIPDIRSIYCLKGLIKFILYVKSNISKTRLDKMLSVKLKKNFPYFRTKQAKQFRKY